MTDDDRGDDDVDAIEDEADEQDAPEQDALSRLVRQLAEERIIQPSLADFLR